MGIALRVSAADSSEILLCSLGLRKEQLRCSVAQKSLAQQHSELTGGRNPKSNVRAGGARKLNAWKDGVIMVIEGLTLKIVRYIVR